MSKTAALTVLQRTADHFQSQLKDSFMAFLVYGSVLQKHFKPHESNLNMILIVDDETDINNVRQAFLPLWRDHQTLYQRGPLVARHSSFIRFLNVYPAFNDHLNRHARIISQQNFESPQIPIADPNESKAFVANELFLASAALSTAEIDKAKRVRSQMALRRLQRRFNESAEMNNARTIIYALLKRLSSPTPDLTAQDDAPYHIKGLVALYEKLGDLIFVVESPEALFETDWERVGCDVETNGFTGMGVTTPDLFRLLVHKIYPLDHAILSYNHVWGTEVLTAITVPPGEVLRDAARLSMAYEIIDYPNRILTTPISSENNAVLLHDFQNKLLNIRLQNELLARLKITDKTGTGRLPNKHAAQSVRLQGLWDSFRLWGKYFYDFYQTSDL